MVCRFVSQRLHLAIISVGLSAPFACGAGAILSGLRAKRFARGIRYATSNENCNVVYVRRCPVRRALSGKAHNHGNRFIRRNKEEFRYRFTGIFISLRRGKGMRIFTTSGNGVRRMFSR